MSTQNPATDRGLERKGKTLFKLESGALLGLVSRVLSTGEMIDRKEAEERQGGKSQEEDEVKIQMGRPEQRRVHVARHTSLWHSY